MKTQELRFGNLVKCRVSNDSSYYQIMAIDGINSKVMLSIPRIGTWYSTDKIKPIPLTEEMLLNCRFEKSGMAYKNENFIINIWSDGRFWLGGYGGSLELKHIHQLQNIYFALTGKELEVQL